MKIAVAMSGGVDSTVAAYLLKQQGHEIFGITMKHFEDEKQGFPAEDGLNQAINNAKRICKILNIEHHIIDVSKEFEEIVIANFLQEYEAARTPNPCVLCNPTIKFGIMLEKAIELGAEAMATGHYIRLQRDNNKVHIFRPTDKNKDQTYMLWALSQNQLDKIIFPLADYKKEEIRKIAHKFDIKVSRQKDSQEICFVYGNYTDYIRDKVDFAEGDVILENHGQIGTHKGLPFYTIGQRRGLGIAWNCPIYIKKLNKKKNQIVVTDSKDKLKKDSFYIKDANWIQPDFNERELTVQIRYNSKPVPVKSIIELPGKLKVELEIFASSITPGQSAVFYHENELIGGGIIL